jgi:creatine kinase
MSKEHKPVSKEDAIRAFVVVDWQIVVHRFSEQRDAGNVSLANKHFTDEVLEWAQKLPREMQLRLLDIIISGLANDDAQVGAYLTRPQDLEDFAFYLDRIVREYHGIVGDTRQEHDWDIPVGEYELTRIDPGFGKVSMRARVARNVDGWNLPSAMGRDERLAFETFIEDAFAQLPFPGSYRSLTPGHALEISAEEAEQMRRDHLLFNDMTTDGHLTAGGIASHWPIGRGIWLSADKTKMIWVGEEDHLRIISIVYGSDLGAVDKSLGDLLTSLEQAGVSFARHPVYGVVTTCLTNMGTGKRQSVLAQFPGLSRKGTDEAHLKARAKELNLQARGLSGEHSQMDEAGTSDISPRARFGVTEAKITKMLFEGLMALYALERQHRGEDVSAAA